MKLYGAFTKVEKQPDGTLIVEGIASSDTVDSQGETVRPSAIQKAIPGYLRADGSGPLREMHQPIAAGKTTAIDVQPDGKTYIVTKVVDPNTILKVTEKVLQGFSIGGHVPPGGRNKENPKVIESIVLTEISLVDRPANPDAVVTVVKLDEPGTTKADPPAPAPGQESNPTNAGGAVQPGSNQPSAAGSTPAPPSPPAIAPVTPGTAVPPAAPPTAPAPAPPTPAEQPPTTVVPPPNSPAVPSPVPGAPATSTPPPKSPTPPARPKKLAKGMYTISWAAEVISGLSSLVSDVTWETNFEGDGSTIPARLKALCTELVGIFQDLVEEETAELVATMPDAEPPVVIAAAEKAGTLRKSERLATIVREFVAASRSGKALDRKAELRAAVAKAIDELRDAELPASELQKRTDAAEAATKAAGDALKKVLVERDELKKQLEAANVKLAQKGALKVVAVEKKDDGRTTADEDLEKLPPEEQIKKIHAQGGVPYGRAPLR